MDLITQPCKIYITEHCISCLCHTMGSRVYRLKRGSVCVTEAGWVRKYRYLQLWLYIQFFIDDSPSNLRPSSSLLPSLMYFKHLDLSRFFPLQAAAAQSCTDYVCKIPRTPVHQSFAMLKTSNW